MAVTFRPLIIAKQLITKPKREKYIAIKKGKIRVFFLQKAKKRDGGVCKGQNSKRGEGLMQGGYVRYEKCSVCKRLWVYPSV